MTRGSIKCAGVLLLVRPFLPAAAERRFMRAPLQAQLLAAILYRRQGGCL
jgi:hypothetical protein